MKKPGGHYCHLCGRRRANEKFSGKGHALHVCKDCAADKRAARRAKRKPPAGAAGGNGGGQGNDAFRREARAYLDRYYAEFPDPDLAHRAAKGLRFLASAEHLVQGRPAEWAAGLVYALATAQTPAVPTPYALNDDLTRIFGVEPEVVRKRAADVRAELAVFPDTGDAHA